MVRQGKFAVEQKIPNLVKLKGYHIKFDDTVRKRKALQYKI